jgi:outer membrane protein assembly factor BamB
MKRLAESHEAKLSGLKTTKAISSVSILLLTILLSTFIFVPLVVATFSTNDDWPTFQHDASHSGSSTSNVPLTNQSLWIFTTGDKVEGSPVVANGAVYVGSEDGYFYALNAYNGSLLWRYNTYGPIQSAATVVDGVVYFGGFHSHAVFALNASTGELIWNSPTTSNYPNKISSTTVANGLVYVEINNDGFGGELRALNASTGSLVWKYDPSSWLSTSPALYGDKLYVGLSDQIVALDANSGSVEWNYLVMRTGPSANTGDGAYSGYSSLTVSDGLLYIGTAVQTVQGWNHQPVHLFGLET